MILRPYQQAAVEALRERFQAGFKAPICNAPTGAGKTIIASEIIRLARERGTRSLFLVPRIELLNQSVSKLQAAGITDVRTIQAQNDIGPRDALVTVASIPTLTSERWLTDPVPADLVLMDECHHGKARTYDELLSRYQQAKKLGLTATVQRGDGRALDNFDTIVTVASVRELVAADALVPSHVFAPPRIMDSRELAQDPVDAYEQRAKGKKTIVFCSTVAAARETCERFNSRGIASRWLSGESRDRDEIVEAFSKSEFRVLVNVNCLIEGFDDPETEVAILARRFTHVGSYLQACGRVLRPFPGKRHATVIDLCGSALVHGTPDLDREYSLDGKGIRDVRASLRQCQQCGAVFEQRPSCPYCAFATPPLTRKQAKALGLELHQVTENHKPTSWPMRAKRAGVCASCRQTTRQGEWIVYSSQTRQVMHPSCAHKAAARRAA